MSGPLGATIDALREAASARERCRASVRESWDDGVYRSIDRRVLLRLETEGTLGLAGLSRADDMLRQALQLLKG